MEEKDQPIQKSSQEIFDEMMVMQYCDLLKNMKHYCDKDDDPYELTDNLIVDYWRGCGLDG